MNERDKRIFSGVLDHYKDARKKIKPNRIIGIFLEGSQNYNMDTPSSDIDTKLFIFPSIEGIIYNKDAISTTWIRDNKEHISVKDIRLAMNTFRKQNLNFIEVLFTNYYILNPNYENIFKQLREHREDIARYNEYLAIMAMTGVAQNKYNMVFKNTISTNKEIEQFGYSPKQLYQLRRIRYFLEHYLDGEEYLNCMQPPEEVTKELIETKQGKYNLKDAKLISEDAITSTNDMRQMVLDNVEDYCHINFDTEELMRAVQEELMLEYLRKEI